MPKLYRHSNFGAIAKGYVANLGTVDTLAENEDRLYEDLALGEYRRIKLQQSGPMPFE